MVMTDPQPVTASTSEPSEHRGLFLETAASLGARICRDALWGGGVCNWIGFSMENLDGRWRNVHRAYGGELYSGTSGIALFLAHLHRATGERAFRRTALGAIHHALEHGTAEIAPPARVGAYSGWTGLADAALQIAALLGEEPLIAPGPGAPRRSRRDRLRAQFRSPGRLRRSDPPAPPRRDAGRGRAARRPSDRDRRTDRRRLVMGRIRHAGREAEREPARLLPRRGRHRLGSSGAPPRHRREPLPRSRRGSLPLRTPLVRRRARQLARPARPGDVRHGGARRHRRSGLHDRLVPRRRGPRPVAPARLGADRR